MYLDVLATLTGAYFHQDWDAAEHSSWEETVHVYIDGVPELAKRLSIEVAAVRSLELSDEELDDLLVGLGMAVDFGLPVSDWLAEVESLASQLS